MIDWSRGKGHAKAALQKWFAAIPNPPARPVTQRRRGTFQLLKDAFAQLSAWRAKRAGLTHGEYRALLDKGGLKLDGKEGSSGFVRKYSDASAFHYSANGGAKNLASAKAALLGNDGSWFNNHLPL